MLEATVQTLISSADKKARDAEAKSALTLLAESNACRRRSAEILEKDLPEQEKEINRTRNGLHTLFSCYHQLDDTTCVVIAGMALVQAIGKPRKARTFRDLADVFKWNVLKNFSETYPIELDHKLAIAVYWLASSAEFRTIGNLFGVSKSTVHKCVHEICNVIPENLLEKYVKFPKDAAYPLKPWLMKPYTHIANLSISQKTFNYRLSRARMTNEKTFGRLKGRWRLLLKRMDVGVVFASNVVTTCVILHNLCEMHRETYIGHEVEDVDDTEDEENDDDAQEDDLTCAKQLRDDISVYFTGF
ncbi:uncharacterized protein [Haliotis cracherodii]|uniref:uncharacterized protein n=1 Tax=Haliotis cracherodii TaxID=6455 RepID=UPI0039E9CB41